MTKVISNRVALAAIAAVLVSQLAASAIAQGGFEEELVIDDFTSGKVAISLSGGSTENTHRSQSGTMLGGWRQIGYIIRAPAGMPDIPAGYVEVIPELGKVVANHDYNTAHRLSYRYGKGYGREAPGAALYVDLSTFDRFEVDFEGIDLNVTVYIMVCTNNCGQRAVLGTNIVKDGRIANIYNGTTHVMPFTDFTVLPGFDWTNVTLIQMFTQTSNSAKSVDFAIERFVATAGEM